MNRTQHKFLTTCIVFLITIMGVIVAAQFQDITLGAMNIGLLLVNTLLLLIIIGILLSLKDIADKGAKKKIERG